MYPRRTMIGGALAALCAVAGKAHAAYGDIPPLKSIAPYPLGVAVRRPQLDDPSWTALAAQQFSRLTPEWEMKMEYVLRDDGSLQTDRSDAIAAFARRNGMALHGHTLIWYAQDGTHFQRLKSRPDAFLAAYADYIQAVMTRYRGLAAGWDVVNEPVWNDGHDLRPCLWRDVLGDDYIALALTAARQADPGAVLFLNDYNLELTPKKRVRFLRLCEDLLKAGAPLDGIGTQTHIGADLLPGAIRVCLADVASLGLKVHVSEVDITTRGDNGANVAQPRIAQVRLIEELMTAYGDIAPAQRYGMTFWALRDRDSWLNGPKERGLVPDEPALFDNLGRPKPMAQAVAAGLASR